MAVRLQNRALRVQLIGLNLVVVVVEEMLLPVMQLLRPMYPLPNHHHALVRLVVEVVVPAKLRMTKNMLLKILKRELALRSYYLFLC